MVEFTPPLRSDLAGQRPYGAPQLDVPVRLNVNENPFPPSADLARDLADAVEQTALVLNRYPDRDFFGLRGELASYLSAESQVEVTAEQIWAANGSNEVMAHVMAAFGGPGRRALSFPPTYSMYPEYARESFTELVEVPRTVDFRVDLPAALAAIKKERPSMVLVASPNNPTGTATPLSDVVALVEAVMDVGGMCVIDEAYVEFRHDGVPSALELLAQHPNLIVTRTMSKAFAMAGARVGYAAAHPSVVEALQLVRLPYHLSAVTQAVASVALRHSEELQRDLETLRRERDQMSALLIDRGLRVVPSEANFLLFGRFVDRSAVWRRILDDGVLIRETGPDGWLRVSMGTPDENARFVAALDAALAQAGSTEGMAVVDE